MADPKSKPLDPKLLAADLVVIDNLADIKDYKPQRPAFSLANAEAAAGEQREAEAEFNRIEAAFKTARDRKVAADHAVHDMSLGVKEQVVGQYGSDSDQIQALGRKKKSERKAPTRKPKPAA